MRRFVKAAAGFLTAHFPRGLVAGPARRAFLWLYEHLSIGGRARVSVRAVLGVAATEKTPPVLAETYQLLALLAALVLMAVIGVLPRTWAQIVGVIALYRPFEILIVAINWLFIDRSPIHSYTRAMALFFINILEVVLFFAVAYVGLGCVRSVDGIGTALYSSLRTSVTIGPTATAEPPVSLCCGSLLVSQITLSYFLAVVVLAHAVGALRKREEVSKQQASTSAAAQQAAAVGERPAE